MKGINEDLKPKSADERYQRYLASVGAFEKCCKNCEFLVGVEETGLAIFSKRIFCKAESCVK